LSLKERGKNSNPKGNGEKQRLLAPDRNMRHRPSFERSAYGSQNPWAMGSRGKTLGVQKTNRASLSPSTLNQALGNPNLNRKI